MWVRLVAGIVMLALGGVWIAQGTGHLHGSFMTGEGIWTVIGALVALAGVMILSGIARDRRRARNEDDEPVT